MARVDDVCAAYDEALERLQLSYGPNSQAAAFLRYQYLAALCDMATVDSRAEVKRRITLITRTLREQLENAVPEHVPPKWSTIVDSSTPIIRFSADYYARHYRHIGLMIAEHVVALRHDALKTLKSLSTYMYVIDETGQLLVYGDPYSIDELVLGRNVPKVNGHAVTHATLVPDRLCAISAGEIVVVGDGSVDYVIANTKSGHFLPPPASAIATERTIAEIFDLPSDRIIVFSNFARFHQLESA